jgi:hypothetical protein
VEIKDREYLVKTFIYIANFVVVIKGLEFTLSAVGIFFSLVKAFIYLLNFLIRDTSPRTGCSGGTGEDIGIAFLVAKFLGAVDDLEIGAIKNSFGEFGTSSTDSSAQVLSSCSSTDSSRCLVIRFVDFFFQMFTHSSRRQAGGERCQFRWCCLAKHLEINGSNFSITSRP